MSDMASLKRLIKAMSREPNGQTRQDMLVGINAMLDMMDEPQVINVMSAPAINFFEGETLEYAEAIEPELSTLKARKARQKAGKMAMDNLRIEIDPDTGERKIGYAEPHPGEDEPAIADDGPMGYAQANGLGVDKDGRFFVKDRKGRTKPTRKPVPASAENPSWGTFA